MKLKKKIKQISNDYPQIDWKMIINSLPQVTVSFVIPSYNSESSLALVLMAINNQLLKNLISEVIIIDDASTDNTHKLIQDITPGLDIKIVYQRNPKRKYAASCRNLGIEIASGEVICFIDSDIVIPKNYLNFHLSLHELQANCISLSFRSFINLNDLLVHTELFPLKNYINEFRVQKIIPASWCDTPSRKLFENVSLRLFNETNGFRFLGYGKTYFWTLPEVCLGCAITYRKNDLLLVNGVPVNFIGWGYNDVTLAAKVIALGRYVIPILDCGVYHITHPKRSGGQRFDEFTINKLRYQKLIELDELETYKTFIPSLDF